SPYSSILYTNHSPSTAELAQLNTFLAGPLQKLSGLKLEISQLQERIRALSAERDRAMSYINAHRAVTSAIRRFPAEILTEIFVHCIPADRYPVRSLKEAPLILTTICRSWRAVSLSAPCLWK
ncbi:hypothetical protein GYMLUDRAFT_132881, partial [Collybiopsis luxurians FD-317 M1]